MQPFEDQTGRAGPLDGNGVHVWAAGGVLAKGKIIDKGKERRAEHLGRAGDALVWIWGGVLFWQLSPLEGTRRDFHFPF